jgi:hypothetical protein
MANMIHEYSPEAKELIYEHAKEVDSLNGR